MAELILLATVVAGVLCGIFARTSQSVNTYAAVAILIASVALVEFSFQLAEGAGVTIELYGDSIEAHVQTFCFGIFGASASMAVILTNVFYQVLRIL